MFILYAEKTRLSVQKSEPVTSGSVNVYPVRFQFSPDWDGMVPTAVFRADWKTYAVVLDQNGEPLRAEVPDIEHMLEMLEEDYEPEEEEEEELDEDEEDDSPRLSAYTFSNPSRLMSVGANEYVPPENMEPILVKNANIQSGVLERSGTDMAKEMVRMIECQRAYSYALKMVMTSDEIESTINSLRG